MLCYRPHVRSPLGAVLHASARCPHMLTPPLVHASTRYSVLFKAALALCSPSGTARRVSTAGVINTSRGYTEGWGSLLRWSKGDVNRRGFSFASPAPPGALGNRLNGGEGAQAPHPAPQLDAGELGAAHAPEVRRVRSRQHDVSDRRSAEPNTARSWRGGIRSCGRDPAAAAPTSLQADHLSSWA